MNRIGGEEQLLLVRASSWMSYIAVMRPDRYGLFSFGQIGYGTYLLGCEIGWVLVLFGIGTRIMDIFLVWIMGCGKSHILVSNKLRNTESKPRAPTRIFHPFTGLRVQRADYTLLCLVWLFSHLICFAIMDLCITCMVLRCMPWTPVVVQHSSFPSTDEED